MARNIDAFVLMVLFGVVLSTLFDTHLQSIDTLSMSLLNIQHCNNLSQ